MALAIGAISLIQPLSVVAQQRDTTVSVATAPGPAARAAQPPDRPPISPRRALVYGLLVPGSAQSILGRHRTAAAMLTLEAVSVVMIREASAGVRQARLGRRDTVITSFVDQTGAALTSPTRDRGRFAQQEVRSRRAHVEDWIAVLVANHLFSGAEAFVSANLWDVRAQVGFRSGPDDIRVAIHIPW